MRYGDLSMGRACAEARLFAVVLVLFATLPAPDAGAASVSDEGAALSSFGRPAGWKADGPPRLFAGDALTNHIDGGAEVFFELGFERLTFQRFRKGKSVIGVELYRMSDPVAALGVYLSKCGKETPDPRFRERHTAGRHQLAFVRGEVYCVIDDLGGGHALAPVLVDFAARLARKLASSEALAPFDRLPTERRVPGSERVLRGPLALQSIVTLGDGNPLRLSTRTTAVAAGYSGGAGGDERRIFVSYPDAAEAAAAFRDLVAGLDPELTPISTTEDHLVFRDRAGRFGVATLSAERLEIGVGLERPPP